MEEDKKVNDVETSILENPLNNTKIDITGDLTKMVEEVKNIETASNEESKEEVIENKDIPVIEPKPVEEEKTQNEVTPIIESTPEVKSEVIVTSEIQIEEKKEDVLEDKKDEVVEEKKEEITKKKLPFNLWVVLVVLLICIVSGYFLWGFFRNEDGSYKEEFMGATNEGSALEEDKNTYNDFVSTPSDDVVSTPSDDIVYKFNTGKYIFNEKTLYLNSDNTFYYLIDNNGCVGGNYGTYTVDGNIIDLTSTKYFDCATCTESTENNLNLFVVNIREDGRISLHNQVFDYVSLENGNNLFVCNNENAN